MKKFLLVILWFPTAFFTLLLSFFLLFYISNVKFGEFYIHSQAQNLSLKSEYQFYAALPDLIESLSSTIQVGDARSQLICEFIKSTRSSSELIDYCDYLVDVADKYNLDFRLLPAIAMQESNLCEKAPASSYNCWGYGIYGDKVTRFNNFEEAIETVARGLKNNYIDKGLTSPEEIMSRYTPRSEGSWSYAVNKFMLQMK